MSTSVIRSMCRDTVTIEPFVSADEYGVATYGDAATYPARVEVRSTLIAGSAGQTLTARGRVYLMANTAPSTKDRLTLPAWCSPTQPPILAVEPNRDGGAQFVKVYFG